MKTAIELLAASKSPIEDIAKITYEGQDPKRRMYVKGYESYFNALPVLSHYDDELQAKVERTQSILSKMAEQVKKENWIKNPLEALGFRRNILALESPKLTREGLKEGAEIIVAEWGDGHTSPVHGHAVGLLHEEILMGMMRVNTYRMLSSKSNIVRLISTTIAKEGRFASMYTSPGKYYFKRQALIHNFTSIGQSATMHYIPEHTRDGRDNGFKVEYFEDFYGLHDDEMTRITSREGMYLRIGDVALVRSENVPEYGDHFIVITGHPIVKDHGLRPQDVAIHAPHAKSFLDAFESEMGLTMFKLNRRGAEEFRRFHGIKIEGDRVIFPDPTPITL